MNPKATLCVALALALAPAHIGAVQAVLGLGQLSAEQRAQQQVEETLQQSRANMTNVLTSQQQQKDAVSAAMQKAIEAAAAKAVKTAGEDAAAGVPPLELRVIGDDGDRQPVSDADYDAEYDVEFVECKFVKPNKTVTNPKPVTNPEPIANPEPVANPQPVANPEPAAKIEPVAKGEPVDKSETTAKSNPVARSAASHGNPSLGVFAATGFGCLLLLAV